MTEFNTKAIHRFWAGDHLMPSEYVRFGYDWIDLNPDYVLIEWGEESLIDFPEVQPILSDLVKRDAGRRGIELFVQIADVMGYLLVERYGGVYTNCDMQPLRPITPVEAVNGPWASYENHEDGRIVNAIIGASRPHDPFWRKLLDELPDNYWAHPGQEMIEQTGPAYLTRFAHANPGLHVFPVETFNSVHWKQIAPGGDAHGFQYPEEALAVHHWGHKKDGRSNTVETATQ